MPASCLFRAYHTAVVGMFRTVYVWIVAHTVDLKVCKDDGISQGTLVCFVCRRQTMFMQGLQRDIQRTVRTEFVRSAVGTSLVRHCRWLLGVERDRRCCGKLAWFVRREVDARAWASQEARLHDRQERSHPQGTRILYRMPLTRWPQQIYIDPGSHLEYLSIDCRYNNRSITNENFIFSPWTRYCRGVVPSRAALLERV